MEDTRSAFGRLRNNLWSVGVAADDFSSEAFTTSIFCFLRAGVRVRRSSKLSCKSRVVWNCCMMFIALNISCDVSKRPLLCALHKPGGNMRRTKPALLMQELVPQG